MLIILTKKSCNDSWLIQTELERDRDWEEMAYVTSCRSFHAAPGLGLGLGTMAYQAIFPPFLVPMKVRCIATSMCLIPSHGPTPTIRVKTLAKKSNSRVIGEVHKNKMSFDLREFRVKNVNFAVHI